MLENITKALQTSDLLLSDLREANKTADPLEHVVLMNLIKQVAEVKSYLGFMQETNRS